MELRLLQLPAAFVVAGIAATMSGACFQPEDTFENFGERYDKIADSPTATASVSTGFSGCVPPTSGSLAEGTYLFALSAQLVNNHPIFFKATITFGADAAAPSFSMTLQPLRTPYREAADNESIPAMADVGDALEVGPFPLDAQGSFSAQLPTDLEVTGKANPFSPNDLVATIKLDSGQFCELNPEDPPILICGTISGEVTKPIPLELDKVNLYAMTKYDGTTIPDPIPYTCCASPGACTEEEVAEAFP